MIKPQKRKIIIGLFFLVMYSLPCAYADSPCHGRFINPITDICWDCFFPMTIGKAKIMSGRNPDTDNPSNPICHCGANPFTGWGLSAFNYPQNLL